MQKAVSHAPAQADDAAAPVQVRELRGRRLTPCAIFMPEYISTVNVLICNIYGRYNSEHGGTVDQRNFVRAYECVVKRTRTACRKSFSANHVYSCTVRQLRFGHRPSPNSIAPVTSCRRYCCPSSYYS